MPAETFSISVEVKQKLVAYCNKTRANKSRIIRDAITTFLSTGGFFKNSAYLAVNARKLFKLGILYGRYSNTEYGDNLWLAGNELLKDIVSEDTSEKDIPDVYELLEDFEMVYGDIDNMEDIEPLY